jgi:biotin carboxylase
MGGTVVIVDPYSSGAAMPAAFRRHGLTPVCVRSFPVPRPAYTAAFRPQDFEMSASQSPDGDIDTLVDRLRPLAVRAVVAGAESGVLLADALAAALTPDRANVPRLALARRHKGEMVRALDRAGIRHIDTVVARSAADARRWVREQRLHDRELVVKPTMGAATDGLTLVRPGEDVGRAVDALLGSENLFGLTNDEVVVQERVYGTEYVIDTLTHDGRHRVTDICRYRKLDRGAQFGVYESVYVVDHRTPERESLVPYVESVLDALGVRFGLAHSEVMLTATGPVLIEIGARAAGAALPSLCELATGENSIERLAGVLADRPDPRVDYAVDWHVAAVYFVAARAGVVHNVEAYSTLRTLPSCRHVQLNVRDGDWVPATADLLSTMALGWAVLAHQDADQLRRDHQRLREIEGRVVITPQPAGTSGKH